MAKAKKSPKKSLKDDALSPAAQSFGTEIAPLGAEVGQAVTATVRTLLRPVLGAVWGANQIFNFIQKKVEARVADIPPERLTKPDLRIVGPAIEAARFTQNDETLQELFAAIIANSMDLDKKPTQHPSYVELIKQLNSNDANIITKIKNRESIAVIKYFTSSNDAPGEIEIGNIIVDPNFCPESWSQINVQSIENLIRLKIIDITFERHLTDDEEYKFSKEIPIYGILVSKFEGSGRNLEVRKGIIRPTLYGLLFARAVR